MGESQFQRLEKRLALCLLCGLFTLYAYIYGTVNPLLLDLLLIQPTGSHTHDHLQMLGIPCIHKLAVSLMGEAEQHRAFDLFASVEAHHWIIGVWYSK